MEDQEFQRKADEAITGLYDKLARATDNFEFDVDMNAGALAIEFEEPPEKYVVSPNAPVRQIWVSALTRSFKFDWKPDAAAFVLPETGETLEALVVLAMRKRLGPEFHL
jgi:iron donor protein CyaY